MYEHLPAALLYLHPAGFNLAEARQTEPTTYPRDARHTGKANYFSYTSYIVSTPMSTDLLRVCVTHCVRLQSCLCRSQRHRIVQQLVGPQGATYRYTFRCSETNWTSTLSVTAHPTQQQIIITCVGDTVRKLTLSHNESKLVNRFMFFFCSVA